MTIRYHNDSFRALPDDPISPEAALAIRLRTGTNKARRLTDLAITMRSPGQDAALALGYLFAEGIIHRRADVVKVQANPGNSEIVLQLAEHIVLDESQHQRRGPSTASCGVCGKQHLDQLDPVRCYFPPANSPQIPPALICQLPEQLRQQQALFTQTGGMHAAARFRPDGQLLDVQEDVGRHNALDKLLGQALQTDDLPWREHLVLVSGRVSFELVQKAAMAGTPVLAAIGAPSSLAIAQAEASGMTLIGFVKKDRLNVYTHPERLRGAVTNSELRSR
ncbi:MAG: formate dehydrogenase accessory sulfurtransferase FdhD [Bacteroidota bacterium]